MYNCPYQLENKFPNKWEIILFLWRNIFQYLPIYQWLGYNLGKIQYKNFCIEFFANSNQKADRKAKIEKYLCQEIMLILIYSGIYFLADKWYGKIFPLLKKYIFHERFTSNLQHIPWKKTYSMYQILTIFISIIASGEYVDFMDYSSLLTYFQKTYGSRSAI